MEICLRDEVAGHHFSWNRSESKKGLQRSDLKSSSSKVEKPARVGALVIAACSKKKGKVNRSNGLKVIL